MNPLSEYPIDAHELRHPPLPKNAPLKGSSLLGSVVAARRARQWALGLIVVAIVAASAVFGGTPTPCYEAYLADEWLQSAADELRGVPQAL